MQWCDASVGVNGLSMALKCDGTLWVWGNNGAGSLGLNNGSATARRSSPVQVPGCGSG